MNIAEIIEKRIEEYHNAELGAHGEVDTSANSHARVVRFTLSEANVILGRVKMLMIANQMDEAGS